MEEKLRKLNVLIPSAHRPTHPSLLQCLRDNGERDIRIIGVDMNLRGIGNYITDVFYQVPPRNHPDYIDCILDLCRKESIDVYYALGEEEAIKASMHREAFRSINTGVVSPGTPEALQIATDKGKWHDLFNSEGILHARYKRIKSYEEIKDAVYELGYPEKDVFIKPAKTKGGRGATLITSKDLSKQYYEESAKEPKMSLESFTDILSPLVGNGFKELLAMEFLTGKYYSVDVLSRDGKPIYAIPKIRLEGSASNTTVGRIDLNNSAIEMANKACEIFNFSYLQNYEMKLDSSGQPMIYDINPRGGASLCLCKAGGANIAYYAVKMAIGEEIPQKVVQNNVTMMRFYDEIYIS